ncbi:hypothetical protein QBC45DRAFT_454133 [Copromyces sp. CBS 386.78]|nr:hypothetical protein QBC45DRAFT_454133 [Copromyces sp. CBS 386.78]
MRRMSTPPSPWFPWVETVNRPVNKPVSLSQASLLRSRQLRSRSRPVAGGKALGQLQGNVETWRGETSSRRNHQQAAVPRESASQFAGCSTVSRRTHEVVSTRELTGLL